MDALLIQEVKMTHINFGKILEKHWVGASFYYSKANGASGGVATLWNPSKLDGESIALYYNLMTNSLKCTTYLGIFSNYISSILDLGELIFGRKYLISYLLTGNLCL